MFFDFGTKNIVARDRKHTMMCAGGGTGVGVYVFVLAENFHYSFGLDAGTSLILVYHPYSCIYVASPSQNERTKYDLKLKSCSKMATVNDKMCWIERE